MQRTIGLIVYPTPKIATHLQKIDIMSSFATTGRKCFTCPPTELAHLISTPAVRARNSWSLSPDGLPLIDRYLTYGCR
jgi:hypothetical protein